MARKKYKIERRIKGPNITLNVSRELIEMADPMHAAHCMVALALKYRGASSIVVTKEHATFNIDGQRRTYVMPAKAAYKIQEYDRIAEDEGIEMARRKIKPFETLLQNPSVKPITTTTTTPRGPDTRPRKKRKPGVRFCVRRSRGIKQLQKA